MFDEESLTLTDTLDRLEAAGAGLRARSRQQLIEPLTQAWALIADPERALGRQARQELPEVTGLTLPMVVWALSETLGDLSEQRLEDAIDAMAPPEHFEASPVSLSMLILAGNVFSACVQPCTLALLSKTPILVKASSRDDRLVRLFHRALREVDPSLAEAMAVLSFAGGTTRLEDAAFGRVDVVSAYGSDATIRSISGRLPPSAQLIAHGHGLGAAFVPRAALITMESAAGHARGLALDISAYDQRGCMSPHCVWVEAGGAVDGATFSALLADAMEEVAEVLPRGALSAEIGAAQLQWRGVAAARGELNESQGWAISFEADAAPRISPGWRNVQILETPDEATMLGSIEGFGAHLKTLGVAGDRSVRRALTLALPPRVHPRVCALGQMQRPGLLSLADGRTPWQGLSRYRQVD